MQPASFYKNKGMIYSRITSKPLSLVLTVTKTPGPPAGNWFELVVLFWKAARLERAQALTFPISWLL